MKTKAAATKKQQKVEVTLYVVTAIWKRCIRSDSMLGYNNIPLQPATHKVTVLVSNAVHPHTVFNRACRAIDAAYKPSELGRAIWYFKQSAAESVGCCDQGMFEEGMMDNKPVLTDEEFETFRVLRVQFEEACVDEAHRNWFPVDWEPPFENFLLRCLALHEKGVVRITPNAFRDDPREGKLFHLEFRA
jgi:hypothetical protein